MTLSYDVIGDGPAVVLLHAGVCDRRMWASFDAPGFTQIRPDLRGFGETPMPTAEWNNAEDVIAVVDSLGIDQFSLVGSSMGGRVALEIAARWPDRVTSLALLCAGLRGFPSTPDADEFDEQEEALLEARDIDGAVELNVRTWLGPLATDETRDLVATMQRHALEVQIDADEVAPRHEAFEISAISARTLAVSGDHDFEVFSNIADHVAEQVPGTHRVQLDWAGHLPSLESPERLNPLVVDFLRG
ncbi:MAG: alpha/beta hydrolase [Hamadaea sp.]|uniref:alpha/beta fold hydrolase n=1 Tax=Hamadaea sp. TaxID=2024425 RepID=UPI00182BBA27|nr:alpha/beta hydrolase [Hamadaea sp.]NUR74161.1 alpha/beta hydrolase [Hamadaea sp.]NUT21318.1 alpha/beta hydrolase [Hamadaea sp.]